jgi:uncharacterized phage protein (TIGR01671 family)
MRKIKFRQWDFKYKKWHYFEFEEGSCGGVINATLSKYPIMQYIGIEDEKGNPIYEGDIIQTVEESMKHGESIVIGVVEYSTSSMNFCLAFDQYGMVMSIDQFIERGILVIGNIHENPNLIK